MDVAQALFSSRADVGGARNAVGVSLSLRLRGQLMMDLI
jgi:hypothetical protein